MPLSTTPCYWLPILSKFFAQITEVLDKVDYKILVRKLRVHDITLKDSKEVEVGSVVSLQGRSWVPYWDILLILTNDHHLYEWSSCLRICKIYKYESLLHQYTNKLYPNIMCLLLFSFDDGLILFQSNGRLAVVINIFIVDSAWEILLSVNINQVQSMVERVNYFGVLHGRSKNDRSFFEPPFYGVQWRW